MRWVPVVKNWIFVFAGAGLVVVGGVLLLRGGLTDVDRQFWLFQLWIGASVLLFGLPRVLPVSERVRLIALVVGVLSIVTAFVLVATGVLIHA